MKADKSLAYISGKMAGRPVVEPAGPGPSRDQKMHDAIKAKLAAGPMAPTDTLSPGDATDLQANDANAQTAEEEARGRIEQIDPDILTAADDPADESHQLAQRILKAYVQIVEIERKKAGQ